MKTEFIIENGPVSNTQFPNLNSPTSINKYFNKDKIGRRKNSGPLTTNMKN